MQISKDEVVEHLKQAGRDADADQAAAELPDQIDVEDQSVLDRFGVDPKTLISEIGSGLGDQA